MTDLIQWLMESLSLQQQMVITRASVIGTEFDVKILEGIVNVGGYDVSNLPQDLDAAVQSNLIVAVDDGDGFAFQNSLIRATIYNSNSPL